MTPIRHVCICLGLTLCLVTISACGKKSDEAAQNPPTAKKPVSFANTNTILKASEAEPAITDTTAKSVTADFNNDGLKDLAVLNQTTGSKNEVEIYIQKKQEPTTPPVTAEKEYFHAGTIQHEGDGRVIGLMVESQKQLADLVLLMEYPDRVNREMIHYKNNGEQFLLISREQASTRKPDVAAP